MVFQAHNLMLDDTLLMNERSTGTTTNASIVGATAAGVPLVIDVQRHARAYANLTGATDNSGPASFAKFNVVIDWTGMQQVSGNGFIIQLQGHKDDPTFASTVFKLYEKPIGVANYSQLPYDTPTRGRLVLRCDNVVFDNSGGTNLDHGVVYSTCRYIRISVFCSNTAWTTGFAYRAWFVPA